MGSKVIGTSPISGQVTTAGEALMPLTPATNWGHLALWSVRSEWHIQDGGQLLKKTVPFSPAIAHKSETSTATKIEMP